MEGKDDDQSPKVQALGIVQDGSLIGGRPLAISRVSADRRHGGVLWWVRWRRFRSVRRK
jgi:hypothetical protein